MVKISFTESKKDRSGLYHSKFTFESLDQGHGVHLGNQLRRILLTNLGGQAISAVRITGITHEFSTLPGVREDSLAFFLNLKKIIVKSKTNSKNIQFGRLKIQGPVVITAGLIELPEDLIILNPEQYIANLSTSNILEMEFKFEYGTGYRLSNQVLSKTEKDYYQLDCVFLPVKNATFKVRSVDEPNKPVRSETLSLNIWTNGSISPEEALKSTIQIMMNLFNSVLSALNKEYNDEDTTDETPSLSFEPYTNIAIEELQLSVRAYNCLKKAKINTIGDLLEYSPEKLQELKNFGRKSADEVFSTLKNKFGIILK
jgi:DNA-directed RNA polymerase subunit alpha